MRIIPLVASRFRSDGGTMFGLVPRLIWAKRIPPDERNRIPQNANSLLVELDDGRKGLIDTGCGSAERFTEKERDLHGLGPGWPLLEALDQLRVAPEDIRFVVFTHLHWDHAGGALAPPSFGRTLTFPNATHYIHALEWEDALSGNPLLYKSYPPEIGQALQAAQRHMVTDQEPGILPELDLLRSGGHTRGHSVVALGGGRLEPAGDCALAVFAGDVCPTRHHLRMVFQTSYDTFPLDTRSWKRQWLPRLAREGGWLLFDHDPDVFGVQIAEDAREEFAVMHTLPVAG
jgi:glyoxylase-like metal-dependent hydrolase (beta-lactamase superfamily II)